jgi:tyrosyl-tRNA synthetase
MLLIRKGRKKMAEQEDWIYDIVPRAQVESMNTNAKKIEKNMEGGVTLVLSSDNESAIELCNYWRNALQGDAMSWLRISSFMAGIIETIEIHLSEEGINPYEN